MVVSCLSGNRQLLPSPFALPNNITTSKSRIQALVQGRIPRKTRPSPAPASVRKLTFSVQSFAKRCEHSVNSKPQSYSKFPFATRRRELMALYAALSLIWQDLYSPTQYRRYSINMVILHVNTAIPNTMTQLRLPLWLTIPSNISECRPGSLRFGGDVI